LHGFFETGHFKGVMEREKPVKHGKTRCFSIDLILKDLAEYRAGRPENEKGGRGYAAQSTHNCTKPSLAQIEKKAREIARGLEPLFRLPRRSQWLPAHTILGTFRPNSTSGP
jgi:hypothetical protein